MSDYDRTTTEFYRVKLEGKVHFVLLCGPIVAIRVQQESLGQMVHNKETAAVV